MKAMAAMTKWYNAVPSAVPEMPGAPSRAQHGHCGWRIQRHCNQGDFGIVPGLHQQNSWSQTMRPYPISSNFHQQVHSMAFAASNI